MAKLLAVVIAYALSSFLLRLLTTLGIGFFTYSTISSLIDTGLGYVDQFMHQLPVAVIQLFALAGIDTALSVLGSALVTAASLKAAKVFVGVVS